MIPSEVHCTWAQIQPRCLSFRDTGVLVAVPVAAVAVAVLHTGL
jgi:hypothetical protein